MSQYVFCSGLRPFDRRLEGAAGARFLLLFGEVSSFYPGIKFVVSWLYPLCFAIAFAATVQTCRDV